MGNKKLNGKTISIIIDEDKITKLRLFAVKQNLRGVSSLIELLIDKFIDEKGNLKEKEITDFLNN